MATTCLPFLTVIVLLLKATEKFSLSVCSVSVYVAFELTEWEFRQPLEFTSEKDGDQAKKLDAEENDSTFVHT